MIKNIVLMVLFMIAVSALTAKSAKAFNLPADFKVNFETKEEVAELKKIIPILSQDKHNHDEQDEQLPAGFFAPQALIPKETAVSTEAKEQEFILPISNTDSIGISTYFSGYHPGIDIRAKVGTPIVAVMPGVVVQVTFERGGYGRHVVILHQDGKSLITSLYAHLKESSVKEGDFVDTGDTIGTVGLTGRTTGAHLHFELHTNEKAIDPIKFFIAKNKSKLVARAI